VKEATQKLLAKATRALGVAEQLRAGEDAEFAVGRAYYAMFYVAEALLNEKGHRFRKHGGVHAAFADHFVKTGLLDRKYHRWLLEAFSKRITGDYGIDADLTSEDASLLIGQAREFLDAAKQVLEKSSKERKVKSLE
jgi:uncharacterized protein (UPF0332 family)